MDRAPMLGSCDSVESVGMDGHGSEKGVRFRHQCCDELARSPMLQQRRRLTAPQSHSVFVVALECRLFEPTEQPSAQGIRCDDISTARNLIDQAITNSTREASGETASERGLSGLDGMQ
jgi:hypothetical protein